MEARRFLPPVPSLAGAEQIHLARVHLTSIENLKMKGGPGGRHLQRNCHAEQREASGWAEAWLGWAQILRSTQDDQQRQGAFHRLS